MMTIKTTGTTAMDDGRTLGLSHVFYVADDAVELLIAAQTKVGWRPGGKKMKNLNNGDTVVCKVTNVGGKVRYETVDEKAIHRAEIMEKLTSGRYSEEEMLGLIQEFRTI